MAISTKALVVREGPTGRKYQLPEQIQAWEADWAQYQGQIYEDLGPAEVKQHGKAVVGEPDPARKALFNEAVAYVREYRGNWGFILDLRASRTWGSAYFRLSERQVEVVLNSKRREAQWALERAAKAQHGAPTFAKITEDGIYRTPDGTVIKVQFAVNGSGNLYGKRLVVNGTSGEFVYEAGLLKLLRPAMKLTLDEAAEFGKLYGFCVVCGRTLTDEGSIERGIGPICAGKF